MKNYELSAEVTEAINIVVSQLEQIFILDPVPSLMRDYKPFSSQLARNPSNLAGVIAAFPPDKIAGKETCGVLEALSVGLGGFLAGLDGVKSRNISIEEVRRISKIEGDATLTSERQFPVEITCSANIEGETIEWKRALNSTSGKTTHQHAKSIIQYASNLQGKVRRGEDNIILPVIAYMSAGRTWSQKKAKWEDPFQKEDISRFLGYTDCLEAESNIKLFVRWLQRMQMIQLQKGKEIGELNAVLQAIQFFLKQLLETEKEIRMFFDFTEEEVMIEIGDKNLPLRLMSTGYQSVIGMVTDLAYRIAVLNPQLRVEAALKTPGVVLIDEIDLHIHPKWQWRIVDVLKNTFPEVHFIATTHSPIVIASCSANELTYMKKMEKSEMCL